jgi:hypothetical protein
LKDENFPTPTDYGERCFNKATDVFLSHCCFSVSFGIPGHFQVHSFFCNYMSE